MLASFDRRGRARDTFAQEEVHVLRGRITYHVSPRADPDEHRDCRRIDHLSSTSVACAGSTERLLQDFLLPTARRMGYNSPRTTECDTWRVPNDWDEHDPLKCFTDQCANTLGLGQSPTVASKCRKQRCASVALVCRRIMPHTGHLESFTRTSLSDCRIDSERPGCYPNGDGLPATVDYCRC